MMGRPASRALTRHSNSQNVRMSQMSGHAVLPNNDDLRCAQRTRRYADHGLWQKLGLVSVVFAGNGIKNTFFSALNARRI